MARSESRCIHRFSLKPPFKDLFYEARHSHTIMTNPDFVKLAEAMGVRALRATTMKELPDKMKEFLEYDNSKPILLECPVEPDEHVFPMVCFLVYFLLLVYSNNVVGSCWESPPSTNITSQPAVD